MSSNRIFRPIRTAPQALPPDSRVVKIWHGGNNIELDVSGYSVAAVRRAVVQILNVPEHAVACVNGRNTTGDYHLAAGDVLEFWVEHGKKGVGRVWTKAEFLALFHMQELDWERWVQRGLPFDTMSDGTIVLNETQVDEWKKSERPRIHDTPLTTHPSATLRRLSVDLTQGTATLDNTVHHLERVHLLLLQALLQTPANWITFAEMKQAVPDLQAERNRLDLALKDMPKQFLALIERKTGRGCRLLNITT